MSYQIRITDEHGNVQPITIVENDDDLATVPAAELGDDRESYGLLEDRAIAKLKDIHSTIQAYSRYAIGAFQNLPGAEVEEVTLKFGIQSGSQNDDLRLPRPIAIKCLGLNHPSLGRVNGFVLPMEGRGAEGQAQGSAPTVAG